MKLLLPVDFSVGSACFLTGADSFGCYMASTFWISTVGVAELSMLPRPPFGLTIGVAAASFLRFASDA